MSRNKFKFKRQIIAAGGIVSTGGIDITAASTFVGAVTFTASPVLTAGISALTAPIVAGTGGYFTEKVQALTGASLATSILGYGVTSITIASGTESTAADFTFTLASPIKAGVLKEIYVTGTSASTKVVSIRTATSTHTFFGSTKNSIAYTTTVNNLGHGFPIQLRGLSTTQWALGGLPGIASTASAIAGATA